MPSTYTFPYNAEAVSEITGLDLHDVLCENGRIFLDTSWNDNFSLDMVSNSPEVGAPIRRLRSTNVKHTVTITFSISNYWYNRLWLPFVYALHGGIDTFLFPNLTYNSEVWGMTDAGDIKLVSAWFDMSNGRPYSVKRRDRNHYTVSATVCYLDNALSTGATIDPLVSLTINGSLSNTQYTGEAPDLTGISVVATRKSGDFSDVTSRVVCNPAIWTAAGAQTLTLSYTEFGTTVSATLSVSVVLNAPVSLVVSGDFLNTQYEGNAVNIAGLVVTVTRTNGASSVVTGAATYTPTTWASSGSQSLTFSYTESGVTLTATKTATVVAKALTTISIEGTPAPQYVGSAPDITGLVVRASYNSGAVADVTALTAFTPLVWEAGGTQNLVATYTEGGIVSTTVKQVQVIDPLVSISINGSFTHTQYVDMPIDITGLSVEATYTSGATADVTSSAVYSPLYWDSTVGQQTLTFSYSENGVTRTAQITADVQEQDSQDFVQWVSLRNFSTVSYGNTESTIGAYAFAECSTLESVQLPAVTTVGSNAFMKCTSLSIATFDSATRISAYAFSGCTNLSTIYIGTSNCTLASSTVFMGTGITPASGSIYVPNDYVSAYKARTGWAYFSNRIVGY